MAIFQVENHINCKHAYYNTTKSNVLFLPSDNVFSRISSFSFDCMQIIFFVEFGAYFVLKCATKILKIGPQLKKFCPKAILNREFQ